MINYLIFFFFILIAITTSSSTFSCSSTDLPTKTSASQAVISGRIVEVVKRKYITYVYYRVENVELLKGNRSWKKELFVGRFAEDTDVENCIGPLQFSDANKIFFLASNTPTIDSLFNISAFQISSFPVEASPHHLQLVSLQQTGSLLYYECMFCTMMLVFIYIAPKHHKRKKFVLKLQFEKQYKWCKR